MKHPALWLLFALAGLCRADPVPLRLADAERLLPANREIRAADRAVEAAQAGVAIAGQAPNPTLSYSGVSISPRTGVGSGSLKDKRIDQTLAVSQLVERGDRRTLRRDTAQAQALAAVSDGADVRRQQRLLVHQAYFDLKAAQERRRLLEETAQLYRRSEAATAARLASGDVASVEAGRVRVEAARAANDLRVAEADLVKARRALAYLIGRDGEEADAIDAWPRPGTGSTVAGDPETRPDVQAAHARLTAAERNRQLARSLQTRDVTVAAQVERYAPEPGVTYGFTVSFPIFARYGYEGEIARAESDYGAALEALERTVALAREETARARTDLLASSDRLHRIEDEVLPEARRVAEAAEFAYGRGATGLTDLLDARRTRRAVELDYVSAMADHAKARAAWMAANEWESAPTAQDGKP